MPLCTKRARFVLARPAHCLRCLTTQPPCGPQAKKKGGKRKSNAGGAAAASSTLLALGTHSGQMLVWDATDGRFLHRLGAENSGHSMAVTSAAFSAGGDRLYSSGEDRMIFEWDLATGNITQ